MRFRNIRFVLLASAIFLSGCMMPHLNLRQGIRSFEVQDYRQAFIRLKPEAAKGQPDAQYAIGYMYYYGQGVTEDKEKALYWIRRAAAAQQPDAVKALTILHR